MTSEPEKWICIVCLKPITKAQMTEAIQIQLDIDTQPDLYFMRHGNCEMDDAARMRLAQAGRRQS